MICEEDKYTFTKLSVFKIYIAYLIDSGNISVIDGCNLLQEGTKFLRKYNRYDFVNTSKISGIKIDNPVPEEGNHI